MSVRLTIHPALNGDVIAMPASSIFDFNRIRSNEIEIRGGGVKVVTETHFVGWLAFLSGALAVAKRTGAVKAREVILVSGESFEVNAQRDGAAELIVWDTSLRRAVPIRGAWHDAMWIREQAVDHLRNAFAAAGVAFEKLADIDRLAL